ncbi:MAG: Cd(II)/Pb(II)-responsive transcriptional regulator [Deltaproteobacteria bacterium]|jgi:DNA-binding transcriptional MerR regulator|nr:Cd(II)/Pb(II)-responsive transcriptional regulator [Deltaproteobacteria bacterium]
MRKIGELAKLSGCKPVTIRFYEKEGLLAKPARSDGGYRLYGPEDLERLQFIRHCRDHGLSLEEVKTLLALRETPAVSCSPVGELIGRLVARLESQLKSLRKLKKELEKLRDSCSGGCVGECVIIKSLSERDGCPCSGATV